MTTYESYEIKNLKTGSILHEGRYPSFRKAVEDAVAKGISLSCANMSGQNLSHANLDGAILDRASFKGSNMMGANLSDASLRQCDFTVTSLQGACFYASDLAGSDFTGAIFGNTDIEHADISRCRFSSLSALKLDFGLARAMAGCVFLSETDMTAHGFSKPPLFIGGLNVPIIIFEDRIRIGQRSLPFSGVDMGDLIHGLLRFCFAGNQVPHTYGSHRYETSCEHKANVPGPCRACLTGLS